MLWRRFRLVLAAVLALVIHEASAAEQSFSAWLENVKQEAVAQGISPNTAGAALNSVVFEPKVVELDRKQPEGRLTFSEYRRRVLSNQRIAQGKRLLQEHAEILDEIERAYGVPAQVIVALWGIESSYGQYRGQFPVIQSLASLAYDGRRAEFFKQQLFAAMRIIDRGDITIDAMQGSWAGAMGQSQFMPTTFLDYAIDHDRDGRRDIWGNHADIFASMANYLRQAGWQSGYRWGRPVDLAQTIDFGSTGLDTRRPLQDWHELGIRRQGGGHLPDVDIDASLLLMDDGNGPAYLVYHNFRVLMIWNRSSYFATTVGLLSDELRRA